MVHLPKLALIILAGTHLLALSGCINDSANTSAGSNLFTQSGSGGSSDPTATPTLSAASGTRAVKVIFKTTNPSGSFDEGDIPAGGTPSVPGSGLKAVRIFHPDGSLLSSDDSSSSWPRWFTSLEIGVSGSGSTNNAKNEYCARFTKSTDTSGSCDFDRNTGTAAVPCSSPVNVFRVSEFDCERDDDTLDGNGGPNDPVYIRATFSRNTNYLAAHENIMVVIEYASSGLNRGAIDPTKCFTGGLFTPSQGQCADFVWQMYLKHNAYEVVQPFLMLAPPMFGYVDKDNNSSGGTGGGGAVSTKQFILPLASDSGLSVLQISRISGLADVASTADFYKACNGANNPANSPLCMGMVFYSMTFFRL